MILGRVTGQIWSSRKLDTIPSAALLEVKTDAGAVIISLDTIGCDIGEKVLVTTGSVAAAQFPDIRAPIDALIIASIDEE